MKDWSIAWLVETPPPKAASEIEDGAPRESIDEPAETRMHAR
jgi:hypothetical protein